MLIRLIRVHPCSILSLGNRDKIAYHSTKSLLFLNIKNMKKIQWLVVVILTFSSLAFAQDKLLTLDEIFSPDTKVRMRFGGTPTFVTWAGDGKSFRQVVNGKLMRFDAVTGQAAP